MIYHRPKKFLGQNFLICKNTSNRIAALLNDQQVNIIEIGPGKGAITDHLVSIGFKSIFAVEKDCDLFCYLSNEKRFCKVKFFNEDILDFDFNKISGNISIIGNLPYNISSPILFHCIKFISNINQVVFMLQKEMADRITANYNSKEYGRLSVIIQNIFDIKQSFIVKKHLFNPIPKVDSKVINLVPKKNLIDVKTLKKLDFIVSLAFLHRRKKLYSNWKTKLDNTNDIFEKFKIDQNDRAENISPKMFLKIAQYIKLAY